jgi:hypothetical protein
MVASLAPLDAARGCPLLHDVDPFSVIAFVEQISARHNRF